MKQRSSRSIPLGGSERTLRSCCTPPQRRKVFTGLVEVTGRVVSVKQGSARHARMARLSINAAGIARGTQIGDSVSVNGVCLTVNETNGDVLVFYAMPETLRRTAMGALEEAAVVNLERAMTPGGSFWGTHSAGARRGGW